MNYNYKNLSLSEIIGVINQCSVCVLTMCNNNIPYAVPMNYQVYYDRNNMFLNLNSLYNGKKINIMKINPNVCICINRLGIKGNESIIMNGKVIIKESSCFNAYLELKIIVEEVRGRLYKV